MITQIAAFSFARSPFIAVTLILLTLLSCKNQKHSTIELKILALTHISQIEQERFVPGYISTTVDFFESIPELKSNLPSGLRINQMGFAGVVFKKDYVKKYVPRWKEWVEKHFEELCYSKFETRNEAIGERDAGFHEEARFYLRGSDDRCDVCSLKLTEFIIKGCN